MKKSSSLLVISVKDNDVHANKSCLHQRRHFSPFVVSVDGILGVEAEATLKRIAIHLSITWHKPYSRTCGYINIGAGNTLVYP